jgi:hypothetical protein
MKTFQGRLYYIVVLSQKKKKKKNVEVSPLRVLVYQFHKNGIYATSSKEPVENFICHFML